MELRFVEREINQQLTKSPDGKSDGTWEKQTVRVLQQKWRVEPVYDKLSGIPMPYTPRVEWRDVPLVKEEA